MISRINMRNIWIYARGRIEFIDVYPRKFYIKHINSERN